MIYRETFWKNDKVTVVEIIPLAGQETPSDYKRFRFRTSFQSMLSSGPVICSCDVGLQASNILEAMVEAEKIRPIKEKELMAQLKREVEQIMLDETNLISLDNGVSGR